MRLRKEWQVSMWLSVASEDNDMLEYLNDFESDGGTVVQILYDPVTLLAKVVGYEMIEVVVEGEDYIR